MFLTDSHCHLNLNQFDNDVEAVVRRAILAGIERIVVPAIDLETSRRAITIAEQYPQVFAAVGIHPNTSVNSWPESIDQIRTLIAHPRVVAIGEIGLDYHWQTTTPEDQKERLLAQLALAAEVSKPVILHSRESLEDLLSILTIWAKKLFESTSILTGRSGVIHSFEGNLVDANEAANLGFYIGLAGPITYPKAKEKHTLAEELSLSRILLETDSPFLSPHPYRGKRNEPANLMVIAEALAKIKGLEKQIIIGTTTANANILFSWSH